MPTFSLEAESTLHHFQYCQYCNDIRKTLLDTVKKSSNISASNLTDEYLVNPLRL